MMEQSKKSSLVVARSILNNKLISKKLERYLKVGIYGAGWCGVKPVATLPCCRNPAVAAVDYGGCLLAEICGDLGMF